MADLQRSTWQCSYLSWTTAKSKTNKIYSYCNPLPNNKILGWEKLKAYADDKLKFAQVMINAFVTAKSTVGKKSWCFLTFSLLTKMFSKTISFSVVITRYFAVKT